MNQDTDYELPTWDSPITQAIARDIMIHMTPQLQPDNPLNFSTKDIEQIIQVAQGNFILHDITPPPTH